MCASSMKSRPDDEFVMEADSAYKAVGKWLIVLYIVVLGLASLLAPVSSLVVLAWLIVLSSPIVVVLLLAYRVIRNETRGIVYRLDHYGIQLLRGSAVRSAVPYSEIVSMSLLDKAILLRCRSPKKKSYRITLYCGNRIDEMRRVLNQYAGQE
jgi:hypothetical protein